MADTSLFDAQGQYYGRHGEDGASLVYGGAVSVSTIAHLGDARCRVNLTVQSGGVTVYLALDANAAQALCDALASAVTAAGAADDALLAARERGAL